MKVTETKIPGVLIIDTDVFGDHRGYFTETYSKPKYEKMGITVDFVQDNMSFSAQKGTLRGLHWQNPPYAQSKLVSCTKGKVIDVAVDIRKGSPTFVGRRQEHIDFTATTSMQLKKAIVGDEAGLTVYMFESSHYDLFVKQLENGEQAVSLRYQLGELTHTEKEIILPQGKIQLRVKGSNEIYLFEYATDGKTFKELGRMNTRYISTETAGGFTGIMLGLYTTSSSDTSKAYADFEYFDYEKN